MNEQKETKDSVKIGGLSGTPGSPLCVPPFDGRRKLPEKRYTWWSWHPLYPNWSKSCWGGATKEEAIEARIIKTGGDWLENYHNKLIREDDEGVLTEVMDSPCQRLDLWERCLALANAAVSNAMNSSNTQTGTSNRVAL